METKVSKEVLLDFYRKMNCIRAFENEAIELAKMNLTRAAVHTYNGEEAIAVGVCAHLTNHDYITSTHRGHGHCVAKGADLERMFAELMARENGYCKGKGGSMHIADLSIGMLGANGIVGGGIPIAVGAAFALKYQERSDVVVCFFGDGASNEGSFHESLNMAYVLKLPVIFVCENNQYAISMNVKDSVNVPNISQRSTAYGIPGYTLDGNDIEQVYTEFGKIVADVRQGKGPVLVEMKTYRLGGHYYGDNENYRTREEVAEWRAKCPITRLEARLVSEYGCTHEELAEIAKSAKAEVLAASERAKSGPEPRVEDLADDMFDPTYKEIEWKMFVKQ